ncbi:MAG: Hpt domain-containing protein [Oscillospiraceae bacterium]|jgi:HPt (histidine-containing phosphotransfer) domain-containing protein
MTNEQMKVLRDGGFDVDKTIERFSGNADMYERFLKRFPADQSYRQIAPAFSANDKEAALNAAHTLKGVSANLGMTALYAACSKTVELIRADRFEDARASCAEIDRCYSEVCEIINGLGGLGQ